MGAAGGGAAACCGVERAGLRGFSHRRRHAALPRAAPRMHLRAHPAPLDPCRPAPPCRARAVSCSWGYTTTGGAKGVGESTTSAVVISLVLIFVFDFALRWARARARAGAAEAGGGGGRPRPSPVYGVALEPVATPPALVPAPAASCSSMARATR